MRVLISRKEYSCFDVKSCIGKAMRLEGFPTSLSALPQTGVNEKIQFGVKNAENQPKILTKLSADAKHPNMHWYAATLKVDQRNGGFLRNNSRIIKFKSGGSIAGYED